MRVQVLRPHREEEQRVFADCAGHRLGQPLRLVHHDLPKRGRRRADAQDREGGGALDLRGPGEAGVPPLHREPRDRHPVLRQRKLRVRHLAHHQITRAVRQKTRNRHMVLREAVLFGPGGEHGEAHAHAQGLVDARDPELLGRGGPARRQDPHRHRPLGRHRGPAVRGPVHPQRLLRGPANQKALPQAPRVVSARGQKPRGVGGAGVGGLPRHPANRQSLGP
mmetsp:Transcript_59566/g.134797  ORF Transcript_59566/g.134797 Transcript_59566/m.134797 type:complete len:222 (-) Transcript_59566:119-784(-)